METIIFDIKKHKNSITPVKAESHQLIISSVKFSDRDNLFRFIKEIMHEMDKYKIRSFKLNTSDDNGSDLEFGGVKVASFINGKLFRRKKNNKKEVAIEIER
jgi:hypothetical protein